MSWKTLEKFGPEPAAPNRLARSEGLRFIDSSKSPSTYRIMYELAVCSDGMTEAEPRSFRQNRPASEYIIWHNAHSPANRCSGCSNTCTWIRKKMSFDNFNAALTGQVQVLVTLTTKHDWARMDTRAEHTGRQMEANTQSGSLKHYLWTHKCSKRNSVINI